MRSPDEDPEIGVVPAAGGAVTVVDLAEPERRDPGRIPTVDWSPRGDRLAYLRRPDTTSEVRPTELWVVDVEGGAPRLVAEVPGATTVDWHPDGSRLLVSGSTGEGAASVVELATGASLTVMERATLARWSGDGARADAIVRAGDDRRGDLVEIPVPPRPGAAPRTVGSVGVPGSGLDVGPTC